MNIKNIIPGPQSRKVVKKTLCNLGTTQYIGMYGICIDRGWKDEIFDVDGNKYIDLFSGASVAILGYGNSQMENIITKQLKMIQHTCFPYSLSSISSEFCERIVATFPNKNKKESIKVVLGMSGSDANDAAIKCARKYTGRKKIISFKYGWHGSTGFSLQANGFPNTGEGFGGNPKDYIYVPYPFTEETSAIAIRSITNICMFEDVAAIIIEPIQGDGGNKIPYRYTLEAIAGIVQSFGGLVIVDEVQSGSGRSGKYWETEYFGIDPDLITSAKGLSAGYYPISVCMGRSELIESLTKAQHVFTYSGNPVGCAVALQVLDTVNNIEFLEHVNHMSSIYKIELQKLVDTYDIVKEVRGFGLHLGLEVCDESNSYGDLLGFICAQMGVYTGYFGVNNEVLRIHPPLIISEKHVRHSIRIITKAIEQISTNSVSKETMQLFHTYAVGLANNV